MRASPHCIKTTANPVIGVTPVVMHWTHGEASALTKWLQAKRSQVGSHQQVNMYPPIQCCKQDATKKTQNEEANVHMKVSIITD